MAARVSVRLYCMLCCADVTCAMGRNGRYCIHTVSPEDGHEVGQTAYITEPEEGDGEERITDPETGGQKGSKLARFSLMPWDVLYELAEHWGKGARKYADRNWEKGTDWSLNIDALGRHLALWIGGEDNDPETGSSHLIAVAWHALAIRFMQKHNRGKDFRDNAS